jgi:hypothetical protein
LLPDALSDTLSDAVWHDFGMIREPRAAMLALRHSPCRSPERLCAPRRPGASHIGRLDRRQTLDPLLGEVQELPEKVRT